MKGCVEMADCSKTEAFLSEWERMCNSVVCSPEKCHVHKYCNGYAKYQFEEVVSLVQQWSDEHPLPKPKTYADVLLERFPHAQVSYDTKFFPLCRATLFGEQYRHEECGSLYSCEKCWRDPYPEKGVDENG